MLLKRPVQLGEYIPWLVQPQLVIICTIQVAAGRVDHGAQNDQVLRFQACLVGGYQNSSKIHNLSLLEFSEECCNCRARRIHQVLNGKHYQYSIPLLLVAIIALD